MLRQAHVVAGHITLAVGVWDLSRQQFISYNPMGNVTQRFKMAMETVVIPSKNMQKW